MSTSLKSRLKNLQLDHQVKTQLLKKHTRP